MKKEIVYIILGIIIGLGAASGMIYVYNQQTLPQSTKQVVSGETHKIKEAVRLSAQDNKTTNNIAKEQGGENGRVDRHASQTYFKQYGNLDEKEKMIAKYYRLISEKKFEDAYNMKTNPTMTLDEFIKMYSDVKGIEVQFPYQNSKDQYDVYVYYQGDATSKPLEYKVAMKVSDAGIETISSDETMVRSGDMQAYVSRKGKMISVILEDDTGATTIVDKMEVDERFNSNRFSHLRFSHDATKLFYTIHGWEFVGNALYDVKDKKQLVKFGWADIKTTPNEKFLYTCTGAGMGTGPGGVIYDMRGDKFEQVYELSQDFPQANEFNNKTKGENVPCEGKCIMNVECRYLKGENAILFTLSDGSGDNNVDIATLKYDLDSGKSEVKKY